MNLPHVLKPDWQQRMSELAQTLRDWPWRETLRTLGQRFREDRLGLTAGSLTFTTLIALVPLITVMLAIFTAFPMFSSFQGAVEKYLLQALVPDNIARPVLKSLTRFSSQAKGLGSAGLAVLVVTALALMLTIDRTLNAIWRVRQSRPIAQRVLVYWAAVTLGPLVLGVSLTLTSYAVSASQGVVGKLPGGVAVLLNGFEFVLFAAAMAGLFRFVPNTHVRWRHAWAGALFVAVGLQIAQQLLGWYVKAVPTYSTVYGALAALPIFLIWIFFGWVIVLFGAVVAAYAPSLQMRVTRRAATAGHQFELAVLILRELAKAKATPAKGLTASAVSRRLRTDPLQVEPLLDTLVTLDWAARLDEGGDARIVLLADPASTSAQPLLAGLLLEPSATVNGFWQRARLDRLTLADVLEA